MKDDEYACGVFIPLIPTGEIKITIFDKIKDFYHDHIEIPFLILCFSTSVWLTILSAAHPEIIMSFIKFCAGK